MSLLNEIASAIGHTPETLAEAAGTSVGMLERVISGLGEEGIDVFSAASRLGLTPDGLLRGIVKTMQSGDPHQQLLNYLLAPAKPMSDPLASLTSQWLHMMDLHQNTAHAIDQHIQDLFSGSGTESYSGPAADTLWNTHQDFQRYFNTIVDHAQTQHTRHKTLSGHVDDYVSQMPSRVNSLSAPVAAFGVLSLEMSSALTSQIQIDPQVIQFMENTAQDLDELGDAWGGPDNPISDIFYFLASVLYFLAFICQLINGMQGNVTQHNSQQNNTRFNPPPNLKPAPAPTPGPTNRLSQDQEKLAERLYNDYKGTGLTLEDIRDIIEKNPNLTEAQLRALLNEYTKVIGANPKLVKEHGALAVFEEFVALAAYDPAHGGDYANKKPAVPDQIRKGIEEATVEMGVMEQGKVAWPLTPSQNSRYESTDLSGQKWDVKSFPSTNPKTGRRIYNRSQYVQQVQDEVNKGENIILDDRNLTPQDSQDLYNALKQAKLDGHVVWWPNDPTLSGP